MLNQIKRKDFVANVVMNSFVSFYKRNARVLIVLTTISGLMLVSCNKQQAGEHGATDQSTVYTCPMHPTYLSHQKGSSCPICGMDLVLANSLKSKSSESHDDGFVKIDPAVVQNMGVRTELAGFRKLDRDIRTSATVQPDERMQYTVTIKVMGYIEKLYVNYTGQQVKRGEPLFDLYSPDLVNAQADYLTALKTQLPSDSGRLLSSSRERLLNWDISSEQIAALEQRGVPEKKLTFFSPANGLITEKMVTEGQSVEPGMIVYRITDYSHVWVVGDIYQQDIPLISTGQHVEVLLDYNQGKTFTGKISWIAPELDPQSRTLRVRVNLKNTPDLAIKPGMNATILIRTAMAKDVLTIPEQALIRSGLRTLVIVARGEGLFEPREVKAGQSAGGYTEILEGIFEKDEIVVSSQFLIDAESNLKAAVQNMVSQEVVDTVTSVDTSGSGAKGAHLSHKAKAAPDAEKYICPMCPEVISDTPAKCPICKMNLVKKE